METTRTTSSKSLKIVGVTFLIYALLVATHLGEFWPFSIYPMFSKAGNPWSRALVLDATGTAESLQWAKVRTTQLPGTPISLTEWGVDPIDLANFVAKTETWDADRVQGLRTMFKADELGERQLLVMRAQGKMDEANDSVIVYFEPLCTATQYWRNSESSFSQKNLTREHFKISQQRIIRKQFQRNTRRNTFFQII